MDVRRLNFEARHQLCDNLNPLFVLQSQRELGALKEIFKDNKDVRFVNLARASGKPEEERRTLVELRFLVRSMRSQFVEIGKHVPIATKLLEKDLVVLFLAHRAIISVISNEKPPFAFYSGGDWWITNDRNKVAEALVKRRPPLYGFIPQSLSSIGIFNSIQKVICRILRNQRTVVVRKPLPRNPRKASVYSELKEHIYEEANKTIAVSFFVAVSQMAPFKSAVSLLRATITRRQEISIGLSPKVQNDYRVALTEKFDEVCAHYRPSESLNIWRESLVTRALFYQDFGWKLKDWLKRFRPEKIVLDNTSSPEGLALAVAGNEAGVKVILAAHGAHSDSNSSQFHWANELFGSLGQLSCDWVDEIWVDHPGAERFLRRQHRRIQNRAGFMSIVPVRRGANSIKTPMMQCRDSKRPVVLIAGGFSWWMPWVYDRQGDLAKWISKFIEDCLELRDIDFDVRLRRHWDIEMFENSLGEVTNQCRITFDDSIPLDQHLWKCTAVVSNRSTVVHEALAAQRPVVLQTRLNGYSYLPGRRTEPTERDRSAVYELPTDPKRVRSMVASVVRFHQGEGLSEEELRNYVFGTDVQFMRHRLEETM